MVLSFKGHPRPQCSSVILSCSSPSMSIRGVSFSASFVWNRSSLSHTLKQPMELYRALLIKPCPTGFPPFNLRIRGTCYERYRGLSSFTKGGRVRGASPARFRDLGFQHWPSHRHTQTHHSAATYLALDALQGLPHRVALAPCSSSSDSMLGAGGLITNPWPLASGRRKAEEKQQGTGETKCSRKCLPKLPPLLTRFRPKHQRWCCWLQQLNRSMPVHAILAGSSTSP